QSSCTFDDSVVSSTQLDRENMARFVVAAFRVDVTRAGASQEVQTLVDELYRHSPEFASLWDEHDLLSYGSGVKRVMRPGIGTIALEFSTFAVDESSDLGMIVYNPTSSEDAEQ